MSTKYCKTILIIQGIIAALQKYRKKYLSRESINKMQALSKFCLQSWRQIGAKITAALYVMNVTYQFAELPYA